MAVPIAIAPIIDQLTRLGIASAPDRIAAAQLRAI
jgi:hypothetical protein